MNKFKPFENLYISEHRFFHVLQFFRLTKTKFNWLQKLSVPKHNINASNTNITLTPVEFENLKTVHSVKQLIVNISYEQLNVYLQSKSEILI